MRKLTDNDLTNITGTTISGYHIEAVRVKRGSFTDSDHYGYILGRNDSNHYVCWQFHLDENNEPNVYWGNYYTDDRDAALRNFIIRDLDTSTFKVTITETLKLTVEVEARDKQEAEQIVFDRWRESDYILEADNFVGVEFEAIPAEPNTKSKDSYRCCLHDTPRTFDWCENNCERHYSCDTVAWAGDASNEK